MPGYDRARTNITIATTIGFGVLGTCWATLKYLNYLASDQKPKRPQYRRPW